MDGIDEIAKQRFEETLDHYHEEYERGDEDVDFALGNQWTEEELRRRKEDFRPALTENHCMPFVEQVVNTAREMRPSIKVAPVDDKGDSDTAKVFKGAVRNIERRSNASYAYDMGVQNAVMAGYGWLRVNTEYANPMSFDQEARIEAVVDWKSVMIDPNSEMIDGSDAEYGFIYKDIPIDEFKAQYPDAEAVDFDADWSQGKDDDQTVRIVEYFYKEYDKVKIYECFLNDGTSRVLTESQKKEIEDAGFLVEVLQERETRLPTVKWCKLYGGGKLEERDWLGKYIPLVPVYGKLVWEDNRLRSYSLITQAKDPQRMVNIVKTTIAEIVGSQPKNQPMVGAVGQFETDGRWANANTENYAELQYDAVFVTDEATGQSMLVPPPMKQQPLQVSPTLFQIEANAQMGIKASLGMHEENRGAESNAISGVAIKSRQLRGDKATYHFIDNLASSIRHVGVILIDLIPKLYTKDTILRIIGIDDKEETVRVSPEHHDPAQNIYNIGVGEYDVDVDVGPSYASQQQEFLDISKELMRVQPDYAEIAGDKIVEAAGGPYADVISERIRSRSPDLQTDDPMAMKVLELSKQLEAAGKELETALIALDNKKKNEEFANQIDAGELQVKRTDSETKRLEALAKIEQMRQQSMGAQSEALADIADAILDMNTLLQAQATQTAEHGEVIDLFLQQEEARRANPQPEGIPAA